MDRRKFLKMMSAAPAVPIAMKISSASARIIEPEVISETESGIVISNHVPENVLQSFNTKGEAVLSYSIMEQTDQPCQYSIDGGLSNFRSHCVIEMEIYGNDKSKMANIHLGQIFALHLQIDKDHHGPSINKRYNVMCKEKQVSAGINQVFICNFVFEELSNV